MEAALPIIMPVLGALGLGCLFWVLMRSVGSRKPENIPEPPAKRQFVAPPNDEDVNRLVQALQQSAHSGEAPGANSKQEN